MGRFIDIMAWGMSAHSEGGRLLERGRLFEEIRYFITYHFIF